MAKVGFAELSFKVFASGVCVATSLNSVAVLKQRIKTASCIRLNNSFEILEKGEVLTGLKEKFPLSVVMMAFSGSLCFNAEVP